MSGRILAAALLVGLAGCSGTRTTVEPTASSSALPPALEGKRLLAAGDVDSAVVVLTRALREDSTDNGIRGDLAFARYQRVLQSDTADRRALVADAYDAYADLEARGNTEMLVYDRLCELAQSVGDTAGFLQASSRAVERYPYDRQFFNLGSAQLAAQRYREVIESQKEAIERFRDSPYLSGFYRLLGQAYIRVDRYQTAQKVLADGVHEADRTHAAIEGSGGDMTVLQRIDLDRMAMLQSLERLYTIYDEQEKLKEVQDRLKRAGRPL